MKIIKKGDLMNERKQKKYEKIRSSMEQSCILTYEPKKCYNGYTLFSNYMGNHFYLMNMRGKVVHTWRVRMAKIGEILPNGHLIYGNMWNGIAETDWESKELWYYKCSQHHDFAVMANGHIMILCGIKEDGFHPRPVWEKKLNPEIRKGGLFGTAYFIEVDPKTNERAWEWWADEHIEELKQLIGVKFPRTEGDTYDIFHSNTCEVLPETELGKKDPRFQAGNVVFSHRNLDTIGVINKDDGKVVWAWGPGILDRQHMPTLIPDKHPITGESLPGAGHFLIFDNGPHRGYSRVLELNPLKEKIVWEYKAPSFFGGAMAGQDRMPNGNTVICEGGWGFRGSGRLFEVTPGGEVVWEYLTPYFDGHGGHNIYRCLRYPSEHIENILNKNENRRKKVNLLGPITA